MPAEENRAVIRRAYKEIWNERNVEVVDETVAEDFLNHAAPPGRQRGRQGLQQTP